MKKLLLLLLFIPLIFSCGEDQKNDTWKQVSYTGSVGKYIGWVDKNGHKNGLGNYTWHSGETYSGAWKDDMMHGFGTYTWTDGTEYSGKMECNEIHGEGTITYLDGEVLKGLWENGCLILEYKEMNKKKYTPRFDIKMPEPIK